MNLDPPPNMRSGPIHLVFDQFIDVAPMGELVPKYQFNIAIHDETTVGRISFKAGDTFHILECAGHIGYEIFPDYRGNHYAYHACEAIRPFVRIMYDRVIITSNPENTASIKKIKRLNATFLNEITVPVNDPAYSSGARKKKRYLWMP